MKAKAVLEGVLGGVIVAIFSYAGFRALAIIAALALRRNMPEAWFSGSIVFYFQILAAVVSLAIASVAARKIHQHAMHQGASSPQRWHPEK